VDSLWTALALVLILEGVLPFCAPSIFREAFRKAIELTDGQLRFVGLVSITFGIVGLLVMQYA